MPDHNVSDYYQPDPVDVFPDSGCLKAGDEYGLLQLRCYAAGGLSDWQLILRVLEVLEAATLERPTVEWIRAWCGWRPEVHPETAAVAVVRHAAFCGLSRNNIIALLVYLSGYIPDMPNDPEEIVAIVDAALREFGP
jgi:hypothetical protein